MIRTIVLSSALVAVCSCTMGPDTTPPQLPAPPAFTASLPNSAESDRVWWEGFEDNTLDQLVSAALSDNLTIGIARARLDEALSFVRAERSDLFPIIDGTSNATARESLAGDGRDAESASAGLTMAFTPDLFGTRRRELEAARAAAASETFGLADARRLITAQVAGAYLELRRTDARLALLESSLELQNRTLEIVQLRADAGLAADLDVQRALADLAQTRAQRGPLEASRVEADTLLAVLTARAPGESVVRPLEEPTVPSFVAGPAIGMPADLIRTRPDLRVAEAGLIQATALVGAEIADLYPSLSLPGSITKDFGEAATLSSGTVASVTAVLDVPLLDAGRRRAEVRAARARADAALLLYERTLLDALRDVETALVDIRAAEARRDDLAIAVNASERAFSQLQALYTEGLASLIDVLDAQRQLIASREAFVNSEAGLASATIDLYEAVGADVGPLPAMSNS